MEIKPGFFRKAIKCANHYTMPYSHLFLQFEGIYFTIEYGRSGKPTKLQEEKLELQRLNWMKSLGLEFGDRRVAQTFPITSVQHEKIPKNLRFFSVSFWMTFSCTLSK